MPAYYFAEDLHKEKVCPQFSRESDFQTLENSDIVHHTFGLITTKV